MKSVLLSFRPLRVLGLAGTIAVFAAEAQAEGTVVVELYTSQGCSSCPAADAVLRELRGERGVIPLTLNVDYWDYLGWKDDLALPGNAKRQRAYARSLRSRHVYTPQMMIDGKMDVIGSRRSQIDAAIDSYRDAADPAAVSARLEQGEIKVSLEPNRPMDTEAVVWLVGYDGEVKKAIGGGENRGRTVIYANVVREWREAARWDCKSPLSFTAPPPAGDGGVVVLVQRGEVGPILGAAQLAY